MKGEFPAEVDDAKHLYDDFKGGDMDAAGKDWSRMVVRAADDTVLVGGAMIADGLKDCFLGRSAGGGLAEGEAKLQGFASCVGLFKGGVAGAMLGGGATVADMFTKRAYRDDEVAPSDSVVGHDILTYMSLGKNTPGGYFGAVKRGTKQLLGPHHGIEWSHPAAASVEIVHRGMDVAGGFGAAVGGELFASTATSVTKFAMDAIGLIPGIRR
jgi:hypothetical protein